jgi:hypothetical protein
MNSTLIDDNGNTIHIFPAFVNRSDVTPRNEGVHLMPNHFVCFLSIEEIIAGIRTCLEEIKDISFAYDRFSFEAYYYRDTKKCHMYFHIYISNKYTDAYVIEGQLIDGDSSIFYPIYKKIAKILDPACNNKNSHLSDISFSQIEYPPLDNEEIKEEDKEEIKEEAKKILYSINDIIKDTYSEAHTHIVELINNASLDDDLREYLLEFEYVQILTELAKKNNWLYEDVNRIAIFTLANLVDLKSTHEIIIKSGIIPLLQEKAINNNYKEIQLSRAATKIISAINL